MYEFPTPLIKRQATLSSRLLLWPPGILEPLLRWFAVIFIQLAVRLNDIKLTTFPPLFPIPRGEG
jgi:hypothetical protein